MEYPRYFVLFIETAVDISNTSYYYRPTYFLAGAAPTNEEKKVFLRPSLLIP